MTTPPEFDALLADLVGQPVSHVWRGNGSALFLEFGDLTPVTLNDGSPGHPDGQFGLMIEWSWRIESATSILGGSWSDETAWPALFADLVGARIAKVELFGPLPEIRVSLADGRAVVSFMTSEGQPAWTLFDRRDVEAAPFGVDGGALSSGI